MAVTIGRFNISIIGTSVDLERVFANVRRETNRLQAGLSSISANLRDFATQGLAFGASILTPLGLAVKAAADMEETLSRFNIVFGENAEVVQAWAVDYAQAVGRAQGTIQGFLADFRTRFERFNEELGAGVGDAIAQSLTQAVVDVASFFNRNEQDVLTNFLSGLSGESEAVRKFSIDISDAAVKAEAFRRGFADLSNLQASTKELIRAQLIIEQVGAAQGDAIRTQDEFTNSFRRLIAAAKETNVIIGNQLLPFLTTAVQRFGLVVAAIRDWVEQNPQLARTLAVIGVTITGVSAAIVALSVVIRSVVVSIGALNAVLTLASGPVGIAIVALSALTVAVGALAVRFSGLGESISNAFSTQIDLPDIEEYVEESRRAADELGKKLEEIASGDNQVSLDKTQIEEAANAAERLKKALEQEAQQLEVALRTPFETFEAGVSRLRELIEGTNLNEEVARRQIAALRRDLLQAETQLDQVRQERDLGPVNLTIRGTSADAALRQSQERNEENARRQRDNQLKESQRQTRILNRADNTISQVLSAVRRQVNGGTTTLSLIETGVQ